MTVRTKIAQILVRNEAQLVEVGEDVGFELPFVVRVPGDASSDGGDIQTRVAGIVDVEPIHRQDAEDVDVFAIEAVR